MATKFGTGDEVGDPFHCAKFYHYPIRGYRSPPRRSPARSVTYSDSASYFLVLLSAYSQHPCTDFYDQYVK